MTRSRVRLPEATRGGPLVSFVCGQLFKCPTIDIIKRFYSRLFNLGVLAVSNVNPYSPAVVRDLGPLPVAELKIATQTQRFLTAILDNLLLYGVNYFMGMVLGVLLVVSGNESPESLAILQLFATVLGLLISLVYFTIFEAATGRTMGKLIMGTQVRSKDGSKPTFGQCLGRSACRFIPFEAFSFLIGKNSRNPIGWHDRFPGTVVVSTR